MSLPVRWTEGISAVAIAEQNAAAMTLHDQLTAVRAGEQARDADGEVLPDRWNEIQTRPLLDDREASASADYPDVGSMCSHVIP